MVGYHLFLVVTLPFYFYYSPPRLSMVIATIILFFLTGISITAGYHRFYSHKCYTPNKVVEAILLFFATTTAQTSAIQWSYKHRLHHGHTDQEKDPYNIKKGFWHAHILWIFEKDKDFDKEIVSDLMENKLAVFQDNYYTWLLIATNGSVWLFLGWLLHDYLGAFILALVFRIFLVHHLTFFINSLAHTWGERTFCKELSAVDNYLLAFLTFGEGYHNYHHVFAGDYRNGVRWYHFDPTKWVIWTLHKIGLAQNPIKVNNYTIKKRLVMEDKHILLDQIKQTFYEKREAFEQKVHDISDRFSAQVVEINKLYRTYHLSKKNKVKRESKLLRLEIKRLKRSIKVDWKAWLSLSRIIMSSKI